MPRESGIPNGSGCGAECDPAPGCAARLTAGPGYNPADLSATVLEALWVSGGAEVHDLLARPTVVNPGRPIRALF
jgi:hypothetical protein